MCEKQFSLLRGMCVHGLMSVCDASCNSGVECQFVI